MNLRHLRNEASFEALCELPIVGVDGAHPRKMLFTLGQAWPSPKRAMKACYNDRWKHTPLSVLVHLRRAIQYAFDEVQKIRAATHRN